MADLPVSKKLGAIIHDHILAVFVWSIVTVSSVVGSAITFYWVSQTEIIADVSANTERSESNNIIVSDINENLTSIRGNVSDIRVDVAVIKERVENLEKK